ncbi:MAG: acetylesterase [Anaerolineae bacterium]|nr:acetylesterase [Anaerolineae bacterium]
MASILYEHLGIFSDWAEKAASERPLRPLAQPGPQTQKQVRDTLGFFFRDEQPQDVRIDDTWEQDGVSGEAVSWSVGYGPRTQAWVLKPVGVVGPLPGVVALHDHGGFKFNGKEKIAEGPEEMPDYLRIYQERAYGGRAFANALAREGFVVLVHDTFAWGSRRFPRETMETAFAPAFEPLAGESLSRGIPYEIAEYNFLARLQEHELEKYCGLLGTTFAGVVTYEDRVAVQYLLSRSDVVPGGVGCIGLSGGGCRAGLLQGSCDAVRAAVVVGMMSTHEGLLDHNVRSHTWMFFPAGWSRLGDWTDLVACRAPSPLLVQYDNEDDLFTPAGMHAADQRLAAHYAHVGHPGAYTGEFYPGPHKFDLAMQASAFAWLKRQLAG